ncbi:MAG: hypothetical protein ACTS6P_01150 [Candidatus Hodgkinia cicadicola]
MFKVNGIVKVVKFSLSGGSLNGLTEKVKDSPPESLCRTCVRTAVDRRSSTNDAKVMMLIPWTRRQTSEVWGLHAELVRQLSDYVLAHQNVNM